MKYPNAPLRPHTGSTVGRKGQSIHIDCHEYRLMRDLRQELARHLWQYRHAIRILRDLPADAPGCYLDYYQGMDAYHAAEAAQVVARYYAVLYPIFLRIPVSIDYEARVTIIQHEYKADHYRLIAGKILFGPEYVLPPDEDSVCRE